MDLAELLPTRKIERYGWRPDTPDPRDQSFNQQRMVSRGDALPAKFSLRDKMPSIFDQLQLGSCVPNGTVACLMAAGMKQGEAELMLSRLFVYYNGRAIEGTTSYDSGLQIRDGIKAVATLGAPPESEVPYVISTFKKKPSATAYKNALKHEALKYMRIDPLAGGAPIRSAIMQGFPVVKGFAVPEKFESRSWKPASQYLPLPTPSEGFIGGHCTVTIGWDFTCQRFPVPVWEERNSWGFKWGDAGHYYADARWNWRPDLSSDFWIIEVAS